MRLHCVGLPHTDTTRDYVWCAYTEKLRKFGAILASHGHEMILYAGEHNEAECTEHITIAGAADRRRWFGGPWNHEHMFDWWEPDDPCWHEMNHMAIRRIADRLEPGDGIGLIMGRSQEQIANAFAGTPIFEWGVGYVGVIDQSYRAFESAAHRHYVQGWYRDDQGRPLDTVIPNSFEPDELVVSVEAGEYFLFLGRMMQRKGLAVVGEIARRHKTFTAGQGAERVEGAAHFGVVRGVEKAELLAGAKAVIVATEYLEPFGGVAVEAMMSGTPVLTTDFGAFPETVVDGVTGFRCSTMDEFVDAATKVENLDRAAIAEYARGRFSTAAVGPLYDRWIGRVRDAEYGRDHG